MKNFIKSLNVEEASQVLGILLDGNPDLTEKVYDVAVKIAGDIDADTIAEEVYSKLDALDVDDLYSRSGETKHGYVDPNEESWKMFEEALQPFINEMIKSQKRELPAIAKAYCIGIINGLFKFEEESHSDFKDLVEDEPGEYIDTVVKEWKKGNPNVDDIAEVMDIVNGGR